MQNKVLIWVLPLVSSVLWWLAYHPANLNFIIWFALAPFFFYIYVESNKKRLIFACWLNGFIFYLLGLFWLRHVTLIGLIVVSFVLAFYQVLFGLAGKFIKNRYGLMHYFWLIPFVWISLEFLRSFLFTGFPWFLLGHTQYRWNSFIQIVDLVGVYGLSLIIILVNSLIALVLVEWFNRPIALTTIQKFRDLFRKRGFIGLSILTVTLIAFTLIYGMFRRINVMKCVQEGPVVGIVQGNIEQGFKSSGEEAPVVYQKHCRLSSSLIEESQREGKQKKLDLIIWPETMFPYPIGAYKENFDLLQETVQRYQISMLIGAITYQKPEEVDKESKTFNSAYYLGPDGALIGRYDKVHLVPIGEYLPFKNVIPGMGYLVAKFSSSEKIPCLLYDLSSGENTEPMSLKNNRFGVLICYESIFPELVRQSVRKGADFIINISNDGWFKNSAELDQMLVISLFRSVENKISLIRATNTGISAFISPIGKMKILKDATDQFKEIEGTMLTSILISPGQTFYSKYGDLLPITAMFFIIALILLKFLKIT